MSLKNKIAFVISVLFTIIYAVSASVVYLMFADFRKDEFENRLKEKALSSIKLLVETKQVDRQLLKLIDKNSLNKLYDEKTLIFDADFHLIYSSLDDTKIIWTNNDLEHLKVYKTFFRKENDREVYGFFYDTKDHDYYALVSANDRYGKRKLEYLIFILVITYLVFTGLTWLLSYRIVRLLIAPLLVLHKKIKGISEKNLDTRIEVKENKDEIDLLAAEFNHMLERINHSYKKQQEFTSNASHELRTPLARLISQLENKIIESREKKEDISFYTHILGDVSQLSELTDSLLLLSKIDKEAHETEELIRIDEIVFDASEITRNMFADYKMEFVMEAMDHLEMKGNRALLIIAFVNLFKNAYLYSSDKMASVEIKVEGNLLLVHIANNGPTLSDREQQLLFEPFMRGANAKNQNGLGLGLRIVKRILTRYNSSILYSVNEKQQNTFTLIFSNS